MLYFAYGSNMAAETMKKRCPNAQGLFIATLANHSLAFTHKSAKTKTGTLDIIPFPDRVVYGVVYDLTPDDLFGLYQAEGFQPLRDKNAYIPKTVHVVSYPANEVFMVECNTMAFHVQTKSLEHISPHIQYMENVIHAARKLRLPNEYIRFLRSIPTVEDAE